MRAAGAGKLSMAVGRGAADDFDQGRESADAPACAKTGLVSGDDDGSAS